MTSLIIEIYLRSLQFQLEGEVLSRWYIIEHSVVYQMKAGSHGAKNGSFPEGGMAGVDLGHMLPR